MLKRALVPAGAALLALSACNSATDQVGQNMVNAQDVVASNMENQADALDNRADALRNQADATRDWSKDKQKAMKKAAKGGVAPDEAMMNKM